MNYEQMIEMLLILAMIVGMGMTVFSILALGKNSSSFKFLENLSKKSQTLIATTGMATVITSAVQTGRPELIFGAVGFSVIMSAFMLGLLLTEKS